MRTREFLKQYGLALQADCLKEPLIALSGLLLGALIFCATVAILCIALTKGFSE